MEFHMKQEGHRCQRCGGDILLGERAEHDRLRAGVWYHFACWQQVKSEDPERGRRGGDRTPPPPEALPDKRRTDAPGDRPGDEQDAGADDQGGAEVEADADQDREADGDQDERRGDDRDPDDRYEDPEDEDDQDAGDSDSEDRDEDRGDGTEPPDEDPDEQGDSEGEDEQDAPPLPSPYPQPKQPEPDLDPLTEIIWQHIKSRVHNTADTLDDARWQASQDEVQRALAEVRRGWDAERQPTITIPGIVEHKALPTVRHPNWNRVMALAALRKPQYWYGDSQCGKSHTAYQIAEVLDRPLIPITLGPSMQHTHLLGYRQADGTYSPSAFFYAYTTRCVGLLDEMDNAAAPLLTLLNGAFSQGFLFFPEPIGLVKWHPESVIIATGNTNGNGGNEYYGERRIFEAAIKERFVYTPWTYASGIEEAMVYGILGKDDPRSAQILSWGRLVRAAAKGAGIPILCTPTAMRGIAEVLQQGVLTAEEAAEGFVWKGADEDTKRQLRVPLYPGGPRPG